MQELLNLRFVCRAADNAVRNSGRRGVRRRAAADRRMDPHIGSSIRQPRSHVIHCWPLGTALGDVAHLLRIVFEVVTLVDAEAVEYVLMPPCNSDSLRIEELASVIGA